MPSLTPLHETYCKWDRTPPSQADVLEGLAQLFSTSLNGVHELIQVINIEVLKMLLVLVPKMLKFPKTALCPKRHISFLMVPYKNMVVVFSTRAASHY